MTSVLIEEVHENVFQLASRRPSSHVYLIRATAKLALIDTGLDSSFPDVTEAIRRLGLTPGDIQLVINTHEHSDHIGANKHFAGTSLIAASRSAAAKIEQQDEYVTMYGDIGADHHRTKPHIWLDGGAVFDLGNFHLAVTETPGHTSGCICLHDPLNRILFSGDTVFAEGTLSAIAPSGSAGDYAHSMERLSALKLDAIFPGHGRISREPDDDLQAALDNARVKLQEATAKGGSDSWSESTPL
ncbi:MAG: MBL fold metallo-hydrolase [Actinobacteria bacterium]|nr:MAG: MBL fold metallo-hydrolase [Actinomycetota bacterium]